MLSPFSFPYIRMGKATTADSPGLKESNRDELHAIVKLINLNKSRKFTSITVAEE